MTHPHLELIPAAPPLSSEQASTPYDERLESLLQAQQELMNLIVGGFGVRNILDCLIPVLEEIFAPAACGIALLKRQDGRFQHLAAARLPAELLCPVGAAATDHLSNPTAVAALSGERVTVADFATDTRWPAYADQVKALGYRSCWAEPIPDCGEGLYGIATLFYPDAREPDAGDERILWTLSSFIGFLINAAQREAAFRAANDRFAALVASIPGVVYQRLVTPEGDIFYSYISENAYDLFGVPAAEILADPEALFRTHSPEYKARFRKRLIDASKALTMWDVEATLVTPDGRKKHTHAIARPTRQEDGSVLWTGVILDETRTREALVDSLPLGIVLYDAQNRVVLRNAHYLTLYPSLRDLAVPGASYLEVLSAEAAPWQSSGADLLRERLTENDSDTKTVRWMTSDGRQLLVKEQFTSDGGKVVLYTEMGNAAQV